MSTKLATVIADFTTQLTTVLQIGGTSATLKSILDDDGVSLPSGVYFFTLDGSNSQKEHIVCSLSGSTISNIQSVSRQGVKTTGAARLHRVGAAVTITDYAHLYFINRLVGGLELLDGANPLEYDITPTITGARQLATVQYVLDTVNGGSISLNEIVTAAVAGETYSAGQPVYLKESDSRWYKALANDAIFASEQNIQLGIALGDGSAGVSITGGVATFGVVSTLSGLTANKNYYISDTGTLSITPGTYSIPVGLSISNTTLLFNPKNINVPTPAQKSSLNRSFGGTGVDGALNISSGTTTIDLGGAAVFTKNYSSISITGTGKLAFTNPHANGTIINLKSQGNVTITSSTVPAIDVSGMGGDSGTNGQTNIFLETKTATVRTASANASTPGAALGKFILSKLIKFLPLACGAGGAPGETNGGENREFAGSGGASAINSGTSCGTTSWGSINANPRASAGRGGGVLYIECGGAYTCSSTLSAAGLNGGVSGDGKEGGGGGGGGAIVVLYNILTSNTGTYTVSGGTGGAGTNDAGGNGGAGYSLVALNTEFI